jgi:DNA-binding response OmpR family regulator
MQPPSILVIEDDDIVARTIERSLRGEEFRVVLASSGVEGLKTARRRPPDMIILDVIMPGMDGYTVCREIRSDPILFNTPILFLTAKIKDEDKIAGFKAGADDFLCKPFNVDELILRLRAILRRSRLQAARALARQTQNDLSANQSQPNPKENYSTAVEEIPILNTSISVGAYTLETTTYILQTPQRGQVNLTPVQYELLYHLMSHAGEIFTPERLLDEVWDYPSDTGSPDLVRVHIKNLRERIEQDPRNPRFIRTVPGYGYTVRKETQAA